MDTKRIFNWIVLAMVIVGLTPLALAQEVNQDTELTAKQKAVLKTKEARQESAVSYKEELKAKKVALDNQRQVFAEKKAALKAELGEARQNFKAEMQKLKQTCKDENSDACVEVKAKVKAHARTFLDSLTAKLGNFIMKVETHVESSTQISAEKKSELLAELEAHEKALAEIKEK